MNYRTEIAQASLQQEEQVRVMGATTYSNESARAHPSKVRVITISQQYGSNGYEIAVKLASTLRWRLVQRDIVAHLAHQLGITEDEAAYYHEHTYGFVDRVLLSLQFSTPEAVEAWASQFTMPITARMQECLYHEALQQTIAMAARRDNTVIVGHGAQVLLAGRPDTLHIRVIASLEQRVNTVMQSEHLSRPQAHMRIQRKDGGQARYFRSQYRCDVNDPLLYDLVLNSSALTLESQIDLICLALECKVHQPV
jgi:cytidylate kinase